MNEPKKLTQEELKDIRFIANINFEENGVQLKLLDHINALEMVWSKKKPTKPGWYWIKSELCGPWIEALMTSNNKGIVVLDQLPWHDLGSKESVQFAGPIPLPVEKWEK